MAEQDKKKLVISKGQCKAAITRLEKYFVAENTNFTKEDVMVRKNILIETFNKYKELLLNLQLLGETADEEEETEERFIALMVIIERLLKSPPQGDHSHSQVEAKLPTEGNDPWWRQANLYSQGTS
ncbi:hypothetical protein ACJJTC_004839 [Scirpophaga incertulas]